MADGVLFSLKEYDPPLKIRCHNCRFNRVKYILYAFIPNEDGKTMMAMLFCKKCFLEDFDEKDFERFETKKIQKNSWD